MENEIHLQEKTINSVQMLAYKDFKAANINMFNDIKENILLVNKNTGNHSREKESIRHQMEIVELKIIIY